MKGIIINICHLLYNDSNFCREGVLRLTLFLTTQSDRASVGYSRNFARPLKQRPSLHELPIPEDTPLNP
jgi:hypothetical protein